MANGIKISNKEMYHELQSLKELFTKSCTDNAISSQQILQEIAVANKNLSNHLEHHKEIDNKNKFWIVFWVSIASIIINILFNVIKSWG